jgi:CheY-like chemotaxis protein
VGAVLGRLLADEPEITFHFCAKSTEAVALANEVLPTVILQDLIMPDIDGLTLVGRFRSNPATALTPVIVLSANDDANTRSNAQAAGASDFLVKLPPKHDLLACIRRHAIPAERDNPPWQRQEPQANSEQTLDPLVLEAFREAGSSPAFTVSLIDQFMHDAELHVAALAIAAGLQDAAAWKATAHRLKGSSLMMGAKRLGALCAQLEDDPQTLAESAVSPARIDAMNAELARVKDAFAIQREALTR